MKHARHRGAAALLATLLGTLPAVAQGDELRISRGKAAEREHTVDVEIEPGLAKLHVRRTFVNEGRTSADLIVTMDLPADGVITSVAVDAGEVEAQYFEHETAALHLPKMPARAQRTVEYTVEVPLVSDHDLARIDFDAADEDERLAPMIVRHAGEELQPQADQFWRRYYVPMPTPALGQLRWGAFSSAQGALWRVEIDAPHVLSEPPSDPIVCFVIDRSRSQTRAGVERQLRILHRWAQAQPQARFQVIAHARTAERLFDAPVAARQLLTLTADDPRLAVANGSELDAALELAAHALADASGSTYLVVLSDTELASHLTAEHLQRSLTRLSPTTTVHLLISEGRQKYGSIEHRADEHPLAELALDHRGVPMEVLVPDDYPDPEGLIVANLLRARRIDRLALELDGKLGEEHSPLWEHEGFETVERAEAPPQTIAAVGWVWAQPWRLEGTRSEAMDRRAAVFALTTYGRELDDATVEQIGRTYAVATNKTALRAKRDQLAVVTPTPLDIELPGGLGLVGTGRGVGKQLPPAKLAPAQLLGSFAAGIDACIEQHRGPADQLRLRIETNWDEIVDVAVEGGDVVVRECVAATVWATMLDESYVERRGEGLLVVDLPARVEQQPPALEPSARGCRLAHGPGSAASMLLLFALLGLRRVGQDRRHQRPCKPLRSEIPVDSGS